MSVRRVIAALLALPSIAWAQDARTARRLESLKSEITRDIDARARFTQQVVDQIFSYGELGFQEFETSRFLTRLLRDSGFTVEEGYAGIPTAFVASWGSGKPVISLGTDIDADLPRRIAGARERLHIDDLADAQIELGEVVVGDFWFHGLRFQGRH